MPISNQARTQLKFGLPGRRFGLSQESSGGIDASVVSIDVLIKILIDAREVFGLDLNAIIIEAIQITFSLYNYSDSVYLMNLMQPLDLLNYAQEQSLDLDDIMVDSVAVKLTDRYNQLGPDSRFTEEDIEIETEDLPEVTEPTDLNEPDLTIYY